MIQLTRRFTHNLIIIIVGGDRIINFPFTDFSLSSLFYARDDVLNFIKFNLHKLRETPDIKKNFLLTMFIREIVNKIKIPMLHIHVTPLIFTYIPPSYSLIKKSVCNKITRLILLRNLISFFIEMKHFCGEFFIKFSLSFLSLQVSEQPLHQ